MSKKAVIRSIIDKDIQSITDIYAYYVKNSEVTFEWEAPTFQEMRQRIQSVQNLSYPYLVLEEGDEVAGYAYVAPFRARKGWSWAVEDSIYIAPDKVGKGYGHMLIKALINECEKKDIRMMVSTISSKENIASIRLHQKTGFRIIGTMIDVGFKFGTWHDIVFMQREISQGASTAPKI